jgi:hypothetical protein
MLRDDRVQRWQSGCTQEHARVAGALQKPRSDRGAGLLTNGQWLGSDVCSGRAQDSCGAEQGSSTCMLAPRWIGGDGGAR